MTFTDDPEQYRLNLGRVPEGAHLDVINTVLSICETGTPAQAAGLTAYAGRESAKTATTLANAVRHNEPRPGSPASSQRNKGPLP